MIPKYEEVNFDGIVGQTHNYSGLAFGNIASMSSKNTVSSPKQAALQGLEKMKFLHALGLRQAVLPPHERPHIPSLRAIGFSGSDRLIPEKAYRVLPFYLFNYSSASPMWAANAATFTPSMDSGDGKVHITPANMNRTAHRSFEAETIAKILRKIFPSNAFFMHHPPLPHNRYFGDEGSANHLHFCKEYEGRGVHLFVYGESMLGEAARKPTQFPPRQTREACEAIVRAHGIPKERVVFAQQNPDAIDQGVFHNDVICMGSRNFLFYHEKAFVDTEEVIENLQAAFKAACEADLVCICVKEEEVTLNNAVRSYLFNGQIIPQTEKTFSYLAPIECRQNTVVAEYLEKLTRDTLCPLTDLHFLNLIESMRNGGGPACLRTRVVLNETELSMVNPYVLFDDTLYEHLKRWIQKHYRDSLTPEELIDPNLVDEVQSALDELTHLLQLGSLYSFQI